MSYPTLFAIYAIAWWLSLFAVLPLGVKSQEESGAVTPGTEPGAPVAPRLGRKVLITSIVAFPVAAAIYALVEFAN